MGLRASKKTCLFGFAPDDRRAFDFLKDRLETKLSRNMAASRLKVSKVVVLRYAMAKQTEFMLEESTGSFVVRGHRYTRLGQAVKQRYLSQFHRRHPDSVPSPEIQLASFDLDLDVIEQAKVVGEHYQLGRDYRGRYYVVEAMRFALRSVAEAEGMKP